MNNRNITVHMAIFLLTFKLQSNHFYEVADGNQLIPHSPLLSKMKVACNALYSVGNNLRHH